MSDITNVQADTSAAAPVDVPIPDNRPAPSHAIKSDGPTPETPEPKAPREKVSLDDAVDRALDKAKPKEVPAAKREPATKPEAEKPATETRPRGEGGKFAAKSAETPEVGDDEPPARFSAEGKAAWKEAPEPIRRETQRALKELTQGIEKYRPAADFHESLKEYDEIARKEGTTVKAAMDQYTAISRGLQSRDMGQKLDTIKDIFDHAGLDLHEFASIVSGQTPDQRSTETSAEMRQMRQTIQRLEQQLGGVTGQMRMTEEQQVAKSVNDFAAQRPRFDELAEDIAFFLKSGRTQDIAEAYTLAERLNPAPQTQQQADPAQQPVAAPAPLNPAGGKSISGSPLPGSDLRTRKGPPPSLDEALDRAFARIA